MVVVVLLAAYGLYVGSFLPAMLAAPIAPVLPVAYLLQTILAFAAAVGIWQRRSWAPTLILVLGTVVAATWLVEAFALGIVAYLRAVGVAVLAVIAAVAGYSYVCRRFAPE
jgi:hypothetical protein